MRWRGGVSAWLLIAACVGLSGCAIVDQYSGRAIVYNLEAEQAQDQALLLNIVRAYLHRPMQFTTVSSITGSAVVSGGTQYSLPTNVPFRPPTQGATGIASFPALPTWQFSGSMSGGPVFTIPVLDTQEFYDGILKAIPGQLWDLYIQANYPGDLLFNLFVMKAVMHREDRDCPKYDHTARCELVFENYVGDDAQVDTFQALGDYLQLLGLTTEPPATTSVPFGRAMNVNIRYVGNPPPNKPDQAEVLGPPGGGSSGDAQTAAKPYRLCFAPRRLQTLVSPSSLCGYTRPDPTKTAKPRHGPASTLRAAVAENRETDNRISAAGSAVVGLNVIPEFMDRLKEIAREAGVRNATPVDASGKTEFEYDLDSFAGARSHAAFPVTVTIYMRHTEGMIYYLGELVRRSLTRDYGQDRRDVFFRQGDGYRDYRGYAQNPCKAPSAPSKTCAYIFHLQQTLAPMPGEFVSVAYSGRWYSISSAYDSDRPDRSSLSLDFLKQLIAVNSSAKSLPQSSVLSVVGGQ